MGELLKIETWTRNEDIKKKSYTITNLKHFKIYRGNFSKLRLGQSMNSIMQNLEIWMKKGKDLEEELG